VAAARDLTGLRAHGIVGVVNCTEGEPNTFEGLQGGGGIGEVVGSNPAGGGGPIRYLALRVPDSDAVDLLEHFEQVCVFLDSILEAAGAGGGGVGPAVLVHCTAGVSRSAACVAAYLMKKNGASRDACLAEVRRARWGGFCTS
jgi:hypothetical protein